MAIAWQDIFGNDHPVEIEIGSERGAFLIASAAEHPQRNYLGIERSASRARRAEAALEKRSLANVRLVNADARCVISHCVSAASVAAYHIYFPDPWWKRRHHRRRLLTPEFARLLEHTLAPLGTIHIATDVPETFSAAVRSLRTCTALAPENEEPPRPIGTAFERKAVRRGGQVYGLTVRKAREGGSLRPA